MVAVSEARELSSLFGDHLTSLRHVLREPDSLMRAEGLYSLARELEREDRIEAAGFLYQQVADGLPSAEDSFRVFTPSQWASIQSRSRQRLELLTGGGADLRHSLEFFGRRLVRQSFNESLLGMLIANPAAPAGRLLGCVIFRRLASGAALRSLAYLTGFGAEVLALNAVERGVRILSGANLDWSRESLGREVASSALMLGSLHGFGFLASGLARNRFRMSGLGESSVASAGMLGGVYAGHGLSILFGFRPRQEMEGFLAEGLAVWAQYHVAGRMLRYLVPGRLENWNRRVGLYISESAPANRSPYRNAILQPMWLFMGAGGLGGGGGGSGRRDGTTFSPASPPVGGDAPSDSSPSRTQESRILLRSVEADSSGRRRWVVATEAALPLERQGGCGAESLALRLAEPDDALALAEYMGLHVRESGSEGMPRFAFYSSINGEQMARSLAERWQRSLQTPGWGRAWLLWDNANSRVVGHLELRGPAIPHSLHRANLSMGLLKAYTGQGLGQILLENAIAWSRRQGSLDWIDLGVFAENLPARKLYERMGFQELGLRRDEFRLEDGTSIDGVFMTRKIR